MGWRILDNFSTPKPQPPPPFHPCCPVDACLTSVRRGCRSWLRPVKASANPLANQEAGNLSESSNHLAWQSAHSLCVISHQLPNDCPAPLSVGSWPCTVIPLAHKSAPQVPIVHNWPSTWTTRSCYDTRERERAAVKWKELLSRNSRWPGR